MGRHLVRLSFVLRFAPSVPYIPYSLGVLTSHRPLCAAEQKRQQSAFHSCVSFVLPLRSMRVLIVPLFRT